MTTNGLLIWIGSETNLKKSTVYTLGLQQVLQKVPFSVQYYTTDSSFSQDILPMWSRVSTAALPKSVNTTRYTLTVRYISNIISYKPVICTQHNRKLLKTSYTMDIKIMLSIQNNRKILILSKQCNCNI